MKDRQGEPLDQRIRQALSTLPDVPPAGPSFDAAALWEQIRPELAAQPIRQQRPLQRGWWLLAASLMGALLGGWWWIMQTKPPGTVDAVSAPVAETHPLPRTQQPETAYPTPVEALNLSAGQQPELLMAGNQAVASKHKSRQYTPPRPVEQVVKKPVLNETDDVPVVTPVPNLPQAVTVTAHLVGASMARIPLRRRFAVVHQNDLRAEAEGRAKLERNDRFVRLGSLPSSGTSPTLVTDKSGLIIPLN